MARRTPDDLLAAGDRLLIAWGLAPDADVAALAAHTGRDAAADAAIAHRLGGIASEASAELLQRLEAVATDRHVHKAVKRALYRLQQRGIAGAAPVPAASTAPVPSLATPPEGYVSPVDGRGDQLVWLVRPQPGGVLHLSAVINDPEGLREVVLHSPTRKALRTLQRELERRHDLRLAAVDWRHADFLVRRAFQWSRAAGTRMEGDYPALRAQWSHDPAAEASSLAPPATDDAALGRSAELLTEPEFHTWFRTAEDLAPFLRELGGVQESPLVLHPLQQQERYDDILARAVDATCGGEHRAGWSRRLTEMAHYLAATRRPARAAEAAAVAAALAGDAVTREIPFCDQLVRASLAFFVELAAREESERARGSLIVTPGQAARQHQPR